MCMYLCEYVLALENFLSLPSSTNHESLSHLSSNEHEQSSLDLRASLSHLYTHRYIHTHFVQQPLKMVCLLHTTYNTCRHRHSHRILSYHMWQINCVQ